MKTDLSLQTSITFNMQVSTAEAENIMAYCQNPLPTDDPLIQEFKSQIFHILKRGISMAYASNIGMNPSLGN